MVAHGKSCCHVCQREAIRLSCWTVLDRSAGLTMVLMEREFNQHLRPCAFVSCSFSCLSGSTALNHLGKYMEIPSLKAIWFLGEEGCQWRPNGLRWELHSTTGLQVKPINLKSFKFTRDYTFKFNTTPIAQYYQYTESAQSECLPWVLSNPPSPKWPQAVLAAAGGQACQEALMGVKGLVQWGGVAERAQGSRVGITDCWEVTP